MRKQFIGMIMGAVALCTCFSLKVSAADASALEAQQAYLKQMLENQQASIDAQAKALADAQAALLKQQQSSMEAQQKNNEAFVKAQEEAIKAALEAQQAANKQILDSVSPDKKNEKPAVVLPAMGDAPIVSLPDTTAMVADPNVICDANPAEANAFIYAKTVPDFVLVDKSEQKVIFYRNGLRILGDSCVTGNESKGYSTTVGIHKIVFMDTNRTLKGSYGTAFVRYWMRFTSGGQGLHDAGWRNRFGETIYVTNGSHGCVNLTRTTAQTIYENAYVGMFVIVEN